MGGGVTWADKVQLAQLIAGVCWGLATLYFARGVWRLARGTGEAINVFGAIWCFIGLTQVGFTVRWFLWPHAVSTMGASEVSFWLALYVSSSIEALALIGATSVYKRLTR